MSTVKSQKHISLKTRQKLTPAVGTDSQVKHSNLKTERKQHVRSQIPCVHAISSSNDTNDGSVAARTECTEGVDNLHHLARGWRGDALPHRKPIRTYPNKVDCDFCFSHHSQHLIMYAKLLRKKCKIQFIRISQLDFSFVSIEQRVVFLFENAHFAQHTPVALKGNCTYSFIRHTHWTGNMQVKQMKCLCSYFAVSCCWLLAAVNR